MKFALKTKVHKIIAIVLVVATVLGVIGTEHMITFAYEAQTGMIYSADKSLVETKKSPSASAEKANGLLYGKPVTVVDEVKDETGAVWYKITYELKAGGSATAYCPVYNVLLDKDVTVFATGLVTGNDVKLRNDAGTDGTKILVALNKGHQVELLDTTVVNSSKLWYRVRAVVKNEAGEDVTYIGWMSGTYIQEQLPDIEVDEEYEDYLIRIGFPESYVHQLAVLHALYPNWVFEPVKTGLTWKEVIENESKPGRNLIYKTADDSKKSYVDSEYNWYTNEWLVRDTSGWVSAHTDYIAYRMDPRNYFNATNIFMFESLSYSLSHNITGVNAILSGTFMINQIANGDGTMLDYATAFMEIGQSSGVSPYHLASRVRQEQGVNGTSKLISGTYPGYEGYYNYFNIGAYGTGDTVYINGLGYAKDKGWNTRYKALQGGAEFIGKSYIAVGQDTLYTQKFDVIAQGGLYSHQYMTNVDAAYSESKSVAKAYTDKTQAFVFKIPVYENMPETAVEFEETGNKNNYLKNIVVSGVSLTPTFDGAKTTYSAIVENGVSSVTVTAEPVVSKSKVTGTGTFNLVEGNNEFKIYCKSESGDTKTYTLTIVREEPKTEPENPEDPNNPGGSETPDNPGGSETPDNPGGSETPDNPVEPPKPVYSFASNKYKIGDYVTNVAPQTKVADFLAGFQYQGCTVKVLTAAGAENTGVVATGNKLAVYVDGTLKINKEIVVKGDISGDGVITIADLVRVNRHTLNISALSGSKLLAADVNENGSVNIQDLVLINRHILGIVTIK